MIVGLGRRLPRLALHNSPPRSPAGILTCCSRRPTPLRSSPRHTDTQPTGRTALGTRSTSPIPSDDSTFTVSMRLHTPLGPDSPKVAVPPIADLVPADLDPQRSCPVVESPACWQGGDMRVRLLQDQGSRGGQSRRQDTARWKGDGGQTRCRRPGPVAEPVVAAHLSQPFAIRPRRFDCNEGSGGAERAAGGGAEGARTVGATSACSAFMCFSTPAMNCFPTAETPSGDSCSKTLSESSKLAAALRIAWPSSVEQQLMVAAGHCQLQAGTDR